MLYTRCVSCTLGVYTRCVSCTLGVRAAKFQKMTGVRLKCHDAFEKNVAFFNIDLAVLTSIYTLRLISSPPCQLLSLRCGLLLVLTNQKLEMKIVTRILTKYIYSSLHRGLGEYSILIGC